MKRTPLGSSTLKLVYFTFMELPSNRAHSIQIIKTCTALTHWDVQVDLVVSKLEEDPRDLWLRYGVAPLDGMMGIVSLKGKMGALSLLMSGNTVAYTRSTRWARFLLDFQWIHGAPVVFETHRKSLFHKRDPETGEGRAREDERERLRSIFRRVSGVVCAHGSTWSSLRAMGTKSLLLWYGWTHEVSRAQGPPWKVGYASYKDQPILLRALEEVPGLELHIFGGQEEIRKVGKSTLVVHPYMPHAKLMEELVKVGVMVSLDEGLKLADYLSLGGAIVAPDLPSTREILGKEACYFSYGSPLSLAKAFVRIKESPWLFSRLKENALSRSRLYLWPWKAGRLKAFLEEVISRRQ